MGDKKEKWDAAFRAFQRANPGKTFGHYYATRVDRELAMRKVHSTIGGKIRLGRGAELPFEDAGAGRFKKFRDAVTLAPHHRVVDYGCGSLRVGLHLMTFLAPGHYFGLDVTTKFIDIGKDLIGPAIIAARQPHLAAIAPEIVAQAAAFGADFVFCNAVAMHVHPEEQQTFYANLQALAGKPGAVLYFNARVSRTPQQYGHQCWSWPLRHYKTQMPALQFQRRCAKGCFCSGGKPDAH